MLMAVLAVRQARVAFPTGDKNFKVLQAFPAAFTAEEADPFLMCDEFGPTASPGKESNPDSFPVDWHPHRGQDLLTYMIKGTGRHADSMGNRESFPSPGMQVCNDINDSLYLFRPFIHPFIHSFITSLLHSFITSLLLSCMSAHLPAYLHSFLLSP